MRVALFDPARSVARASRSRGGSSEDFKLSTGNLGQSRAAAAAIPRALRRHRAGRRDCRATSVTTSPRLRFRRLAPAGRCAAPTPTCPAVRERVRARRRPRGLLRSARPRSRTSSTGQFDVVSRADPARGPAVDRRAANHRQGLDQPESRSCSNRAALVDAALRRRRSGNRHQSRYERPPERSGAHGSPRATALRSGGTKPG